MKILDNSSDCCGCSACAQKCPQHCISMERNTEGFLYPVIDNEQCINCKICQKVCPILIQRKNISPICVFAYQHENEDILMTSSSGGAFYNFANEILNKGGFVTGASFDNDWNLHHKIVDNLKDLERLRRSKYLQSDINNTFQKVKKLLDEDKIVLFTGTPCQIGGLHSFLKMKKYPNLYTIDIICHGVPSQKVFQSYLTEISIMQTMNIASNPLKCIFRIIKNRKKEIVDINFRAKENKCLWRLYSLKLCFKEYKTSPSCVCNDWAHDIFNKGFLDNLYLRQSCHNCHFRNQSSGSDITIGDFWGIEKILSSKDNNKGISAIIVNTQKGKELSSAMPRIVESDYNTVQQGNMSLISSPKAHPMRNFFFQNYQKKGMIFTTLACIQPSYTAMIIRKIFKFTTRV